MEEDKTVVAYFIDPNLVPLFSTEAVIILVTLLVITGAVMIRRRCRA